MELLCALVTQTSILCTLQPLRYYLRFERVLHCSYLFYPLHIRVLCLSDLRGFCVIRSFIFFFIYFLDIHVLCLNDLKEFCVIRIFKFFFFFNIVDIRVSCLNDSRGFCVFCSFYIPLAFECSKITE